MKNFLKTIKIKFTMSKLTLLLRLYEHYEKIDNKEKLTEVSVAIDTEADVLMDLRPAEKVVEKAPETKKVEETPAKTEPVKLVDPATPKKAEEKKAEPKVETAKPVTTEKPAPAPTAKTEPAKTEPVKTAEEPKEGIITIYPFYEMKVEHHGKVKDIHFKDIKREGFEVYAEEEVRNAVKDDSLLTADELDLVFDEAWEMICKGKSLKEVNYYLKTNIHKYYGKQFKTDSDYYGKLSNPMSKLVGIIRRLFSLDSNDTTTLVIRPSYGNLDEDGTMGEPFTIDSAVTFDKTAAPKKEEPKPAEKAPLKTVQEQKPAAKEEKEEEVMDEEAQEAAEEETTETTTEETDTETVETAAAEEEKSEERDSKTPPAVNAFEKFNELELEIYNRLKSARKEAEGKSTEEQKMIISEARESAKGFIAEYYDGEPWTEKTSDGRWSVPMISYFNKITTAIGNRLTE